MECRPRSPATAPAAAGGTRRSGSGSRKRRRRRAYGVVGRRTAAGRAVAACAILSCSLATTGGGMQNGAHAVQLGRANPEEEGEGGPSGGDTASAIDGDGSGDAAGGAAGSGGRPMHVTSSTAEPSVSDTASATVAVSAPYVTVTAGQEKDDDEDDDSSNNSAAAAKEAAAVRTVHIDESDMTTVHVTHPVVGPVVGPDDDTTEEGDDQLDAATERGTAQDTATDADAPAEEEEGEGEGEEEEEDEEDDENDLPPPFPPTASEALHDDSLKSIPPILPRELLDLAMETKEDAMHNEDMVRDARDARLGEYEHDLTAAAATTVGGGGAEEDGVDKESEDAEVAEDADERQGANTTESEGYEDVASKDDQPAEADGGESKESADGQDESEEAPKEGQEDATDAAAAATEDSPENRVVVDYASKAAGALILEKSPNMKGTTNLLNSDNDKYAITACSEERKYVVVGLSEDILVKQIVLANYERYSSHPKEFQVLGSQTYPDATWIDLGTYTAQPGNDAQTFDLVDPSWARYLKLRFVTHYGSEHYCTVSQVKVHGSTMLQGFHEQWKESEEEVKKVIEAVEEGSGDGDDDVVDDVVDADVDDSSEVDDDDEDDDVSTDDEEVEGQEEEKKEEEEEKAETVAVATTEEDEGGGTDVATGDGTNEDDAADATEGKDENSDATAAADDSNVASDVEEPAESNADGQSETETTPTEGPTAPEDVDVVEPVRSDEEKAGADDDARGEDGSARDDNEAKINNAADISTKTNDEQEGATGDDGGAEQKKVSPPHKQEITKKAEAPETEKTDVHSTDDSDTASTGAAAPAKEKGSGSEPSGQMASNDTEKADVPSERSPAIASIDQGSPPVYNDEDACIPYDFGSSPAMCADINISELSPDSFIVAMNNANRSARSFTSFTRESTESSTSESTIASMLGNISSLASVSHVVRTSLSKASDAIRGVKDGASIVGANTKMDDTGKAGAHPAVLDMVDEKAFEAPPPLKKPEAAEKDVKPAKETAQEKGKSKDGHPKKQDDTSASLAAVDAEVFAALANKYPAASCLQGLNFHDFKTKIIEARAKKKPVVEKANPAQPGKIEPIFKTLTDEIKSLQLSQSVYDQYIKAVTSCYQRIILDVTSELKTSEKNQAQRLSVLEGAIRDLQSDRRQHTSVEGLVLPFIALTWVILTSIFGLLMASTTPDNWFVAAERISEMDHALIYIAAGGILLILLMTLWLRRRSRRTRSFKGLAVGNTRRRLAAELQETPEPNRHFTPILEEDLATNGRGRQAK